jgi:hypothetical protein
MGLGGQSLNIMEKILEKQKGENSKEKFTAPTYET